MKKEKLEQLLFSFHKDIVCSIRVARVILGTSEYLSPRQDVDKWVIGMLGPNKIMVDPRLSYGDLRIFDTEDNLLIELDCIDDDYQDDYYCDGTQTFKKLSDELRYVNIKKSAIYYRCTGNTSWILKAALNNPECIIVVGNSAALRELSSEYEKLINNSPWYKKIYWKLTKRSYPKFTTVDNVIPGAKLPLIFDNSCFV